jgi:hypothetical protein
MYWLVLLSFIGVEFYLALVIIKVIACLPRPWLRWTTWALFWIVKNIAMETPISESTGRAVAPS